MENEAVHLVATWLEHTTYGLSTRLTALPLVAGDPAPMVPTIRTERADLSVAKYDLPEMKPGAAPLLCVWSTMRSAFDGLATAELDGRLTLGFTYLCHQAQTHTGVRDGAYVMRALRWSLLDFHRYATASDQTLNGVTLVGVTSFGQSQRDAEKGAGVVAIDLLTEFHVLDTLDSD